MADEGGRQAGSGVPNQNNNKAKREISQSMHAYGKERGWDRRHQQVVDGGEEGGVGDELQRSPPLLNTTITDAW